MVEPTARADIVHLIDEIMTFDTPRATILGRLHRIAGTEAAVAWRQVRELARRDAPRPASAAADAGARRCRGELVDGPVEDATIYAIDGAGRRHRPHALDGIETWLAVVVPARDGGYRVVWARPELRSIGAAFGAAGLLRDRRVMGQVLAYEPAHPACPGGEPPLEVQMRMLDELA